MQKTAPTTGTGWSVGLMLAIAVFGVGSSVFVLRSNPDSAPAAKPAPTTEIITEASADKEPSPAPVALPPAPVHVERAPAPSAKPSSRPASAPAPTPAPVASPAAVKAPSPARAEPPAKQTAAKAPAPEPKAPAREPAEDKSAARNSITDSIKPTARPATMLPSTPAAKVQVLDQASPSASRQEAATPTAPASVPAAAPAEKAKPQPEAEKTATPTPKHITAEPLVKTPFKPLIVMATDAKVWVRVNEHQTQIFEKGQSVPNFGVFKESDGKSAKFESGTYPVNPTE